MPCSPFLRSSIALKRCAMAAASPALRFPHHPPCFFTPRFRPSLPAFFPRSRFGTDSLGTGASQPRLAIAFTCGVCSTRNHKMFSKRSYEVGVVIIRCDGKRCSRGAASCHVPRFIRMQEESPDCRQLGLVSRRGHEHRANHARERSGSHTRQ